MSNWKDFFGSEFPITSIINRMSDGGIAGSIVIDNMGKIVLSGALTAAAYKELVAVSGKGYLQFCAARACDVTSRTVGLKIVIDGVTVFDAASAAVTADNTGIVGVGIASDATAGYYSPTPVYFDASLSLQVKSSLSETDKVDLVYDLVLL